MAEQPGFEERLERLKTIVEELERGDLPLEEGVALFREGQQLARSCSRQLEEARNAVKLAGRDLLEDFSPEGDEE